jgi:hypothetical protein
MGANLIKLWAALSSQREQGTRRMILFPLMEFLNYNLITWLIPHSRYLPFAECCK